MWGLCRGYIHTCGVRVVVPCSSEPFIVSLRCVTLIVNKTQVELLRYRVPVPERFLNSKRS